MGEEKLLKQADRGEKLGLKHSGNYGSKYVHLSQIGAEVGAYKGAFTEKLL